MKRRRIPFIVIMLIITIGNYARLQGNENIRAVQFLSILVIGVFVGLLISALAALRENKNPQQ